MTYYVVTSRMPVLVEWPKTGVAKALPHGAVFEALSSNRSVQTLTGIGNMIREAAPHEIPVDDEPIILLDI